ncbi:MAG: glutamyl-tRNA amidotransferase [Oscillospiraceae bacterium]|nr:glutamyl-tRNA amidotransferase [Oscillospiraceae bacterium]
MKTFINKLLHKDSPKKSQNHKTTSRSTLNGGVKRGFRVYAAIVMALTLILTCGVTAFAATDDPLTVVNNLSDFIFGLIRAIGLILLGFGIVQIGLSLKSHDPSQRANGFLTLAGGVIITFAKEILSLITGG